MFCTFLVFSGFSQGDCTCIEHPQVWVELNCAGKLVKPSWGVACWHLVTDEPEGLRYNLPYLDWDSGSSSASIFTTKPITCLRVKFDDKLNLTSMCLRPGYESRLSTALVANHHHPHLPLLHHHCLTFTANFLAGISQ